MGCNSSETSGDKQDSPNNKDGKDDKEDKDDIDDKDGEDNNSIIVNEINFKENKGKKENKEKKQTNKENKLNDKILIEKYSGFLIKDLNFQSCLIKNDDELVSNLRMFIPTKIPKKQKSGFAFNTEDKILTNSAKINFNKNYLIALTGFNQIEDVKINNGNYLINHDGKTNNEDKYIALVVKKIEGEPQILFSPPI